MAWRVGSCKVPRLMIDPISCTGVKHIYCSDYADDNLSELKSWLSKLYPDVLVSPIRDPGWLISTLTRLTPQVDVIRADAANEVQVEALVARAIRDEGRLDIFFANAGIAPMHMLENTDASEVTEVLRVNTLSCYLALKYASNAMKITSPAKPESKGAIVLTASVAGLRSGAGFPDYSASKAAVISLAQTGSWSLTGTDIRVNAVCPGLIETGECSLHRGY